STTTNTMVPNIEGAQVQTGGGLTAFVAAGAMNAAAAGYGAAAGGDYLYAFGGQGGTPNVATMNAALTNAPPALGNIQSFTPGLGTPRVDTAATLQSGYFYVLGGTTTNNTVSDTTEYVLY